MVADALLAPKPQPVLGSTIPAKLTIEDLGRAIEIREQLVEKESRGELRRDLWSSLFNRAIGYMQRKEWKESRADVERGGGLLRNLI